jgi:multidrug efflux pump subunit AcrB
LVIGLIIILLVAQFNSFRRPLIILITIPLSFIGAVLGLLISGSNFGFMGTLGLYSLAGIIINNAIILIDRIDLERETGKKIYDAIVSACQQRLRPIIITTLTTTLGLLTLIIPHDPLFYGLANIIAYGLAVGTFLTLAVVPVLYSLMFKDKKSLKKQG